MTTAGRKTKDADRKSASRRAGRIAVLTRLTPKKRKQRRELEKDDGAWLRFFFPDRPFGFWYDFTGQQRAMIEAIAHAIRHGGDQSIAASRGEGKTAITRRLTLKYVLSGRVKFAVLFAATAADAAESLQAIRVDIEESDLLAEYYPEVCGPVRHLEGIAQKAYSMLATGWRFDTGRRFKEVPCKFNWCGHEVTMPCVPGSPAAGSIIATRGLDSAVRGLNKKGRRPDVAIIDDPDTEETARSEDQAQKLEDRIDRAIGGLGGQQRGIARVMLTTLQNRICVSYRFTDPTVKPTWKGRRFRFLIKPPDRQDLWDKYCDLAADNLRTKDSTGEPLDPFARGAHAFYLANREAMDAGSVIANPNRFDPADLGDGTRLEESALQRYYNMVARVGAVAVATEYDNDPPEDDTILQSKLSWLSVADCAGDLERRQVAPTTTYIVRGVDVRKTELHDVTLAADPEARYRITDYDVRPHGTSETTVQQAEALILEALHRLAQEWDANPATDENGIAHEVDLVLIDKGWLGNWTEDGEVKTWASQPVELFCIEAGLDRFLPAKGAPNYQQPAPDRSVIIGDNWHINRGRGGSRGARRICDEVIWNADHWHLLVEELFLLPDDNRDRFELFLPREGIWTNHKALGQHIEAGSRQLREQMAKGVRSRKPKFVRDHWWDALAMSLVAMSILSQRAERRATQKPRRTLAQMAAGR